MFLWFLKFLYSKFLYYFRCSVWTCENGNENAGARASITLLLSNTSPSPPLKKIIPHPYPLHAATKSMAPFVSRLLFLFMYRIWIISLWLLPWPIHNPHHDRHVLPAPWWPIRLSLTFKCLATERLRSWRASGSCCRKWPQHNPVKRSGTCLGHIYTVQIS